MKRSRFLALISTTLDTKQSWEAPPAIGDKQEIFIRFSPVPIKSS